MPAWQSFLQEIIDTSTAATIVGLCHWLKSIIDQLQDLSTSCMIRATGQHDCA
jgi:hypothetical protein